MPQGPNAPYPTLDQNQILQRVFKESEDKLRVDATVSIAPGSITLTDVDDSIAIGDGTGKHVTVTTIGAKNGLDVYIEGGVIAQGGLSVGIKTTSILVTDVPTKLPTTPLTNRNSMSVRIWGANTVFIGESSVTAADGYPKLQYEEFSIDIKDNLAVNLYGICESGKTCVVKIFEVA